jgi:hypothetical protein
LGDAAAHEKGGGEARGKSASASQVEEFSSQRSSRNRSTVELAASEAIRLVGPGDR